MKCNFLSISLSSDMNQIILTTLLIISVTFCYARDEPEKFNLLPIEGSIFEPIDKAYFGVFIGGMSIEGTVYGLNGGLGKYGINLGMKALLPRKEATGVDYTDILSWNEHPDNFVSTHTKKTALHYGAGYCTKLFYFNLFIGRINEYEYLQSVDPTNSLSASGNYYVSRTKQPLTDTLFEVGLHYKFITASVTASRYLGMGWTAGLIYKFEY